MEAFKIGENLEFLSLGLKHTYHVFLRTPKLKELRVNHLFPLPPDDCPMLQTVHYGPGSWNIDEDDREERKLDLESRGITVLQVGPYRNFLG
jgi:hypothetical protein